MSITRHQAVSAYRRWVPASFDESGDDEPTRPEDSPLEGDAANASTNTEAADENPATDPEAPRINLPTADDIEQIYEQARTEGLNQGLAEGLETGFADGKQAADEEAARLRQLLASFDNAVSEVNQSVANEIVALAVAVARQMIGKAVESDPEAVLHVVREALLQLPHNRSRLHVNPADAELIRQHLGDQLDHAHHQLLEDEGIARGGCRIEATGCEIDATLATRWKRVLEGIGQNADDWGIEDWGV